MIGTLTRTTAFALSKLVPHCIRPALRWRVALDAKLEDGTEALMAQVGPAVPYRLLVIHSAPDGLLHVELWEVRKGLKVLMSANVESDRIVPLLQKMGADFSLGS